jgi:LuxR family transcriptional regulator, quorum-sensing system regulator BjaR1
MVVSKSVEECLKFIAETNDGPPEANLVERYEGLLALFGFQTFLMTELPLMPAMGPQNLFIRNNWSSTWWNRYISRRYYLHDPVSIASYNETRPFYWSDAAARYAKTAESIEVMTEAAAEGMREGLTFSFSDGLSWKSVVSIGRPTAERLTVPDLGILYLSSIHFGLALSVHKGVARKHQLSGREKEILLWVACGKTAWEIGQIVGVSKTTVDRHLLHVRRNLGAATNAHAVSIAITQGQLRP